MSIDQERSLVAGSRESKVGNFGGIFLFLITGGGGGVGDK